MSFALVAGILVRGRVIRQLKDYCRTYKLGLSIEDDGGFLNSHYFITITGPDDEVVMAKRTIEEWKRRTGA